MIESRFHSSVHLVILENFKGIIHLTIGQSPNLYARITYGNKETTRRGLKNAHLNIRSLKNKMSDIKAVVNSSKPHKFGLSECELRKVDNNFDEALVAIAALGVRMLVCLSVCNEFICSNRLVFVMFLFLYLLLRML